MTAIIIDCETTDKDPKTCEIVELAWGEFCIESPFAAVDGGHKRFGFSGGMKWGALAAHHILRSELFDLPLFTSSDLPSIGETYWIGHNIDFDWESCGRPPVKRICTLAMARDLWPECDSHTLTALTYFTQGANELTRAKLRDAHSAVADVQLCEELLRNIIAITKITSLDQLFAFSEEARIPKTMTFGKFRDQPVSAVDRGYANWYRRQPDPDPYLLEAFRRNRLI